MIHLDWHPNKSFMLLVVVKLPQENVSNICIYVQLSSLLSNHKLDFDAFILAAAYNNTYTLFLYFCITW